MAALSAAGCSATHWAARDPSVHRKYRQKPHDTFNDAKRAIDARHVAGRGGWYVSTDVGHDPAAVDLTAGVFGYPQKAGGSVEARAGVRTILVEGGGVSSGLDLGLRVQSPSRLAPFVGVSGFLGAAPWDYLAVAADLDTSEQDDDYTLAMAVSPEAGVHYWISPSWRLTASARYTFADFSGPNWAEYPTVGISLSRLRIPNLRNKRRHGASPTPASFQQAMELPLQRNSPPPPAEPTNKSNPYLDLAGEPPAGAAGP